MPVPPHEIVSCQKTLFHVPRNYFLSQEIIVSCLKLITNSVNDCQWLSSFEKKISANKKHTPCDK